MPEEGLKFKALEAPDPTPSADPAPPDLSVVIPAFNEALRIESSLATVVEFFAARPHTTEIIVVDDGSRDQTAAVVNRFVADHPQARIRLAQLSQNSGKGAALRAGVALSTGGRVLLMDADLATPMEALDGLWAAIDGGCKVAIASRAAAGARITRWQHPLRVLLGRAGNLWIRTLAVPGIHDTQCGFKLFDGEVGRELWRRVREERFGVDVEVLCLARRRFKLDIAEVGVTWEHREGSKVRWSDYLDVLLKVPRIVWSVYRSKEPPPSI
jgi:dolichyl-phosphate beta-glucosyltransferase